MSDYNGNGLALIASPDFVKAIAEEVVELLAEQLPDRPEPYLNVEQAAEYIAAPVSRLYDLTRSGRTYPLPVYRDGKRLLFKASEIDSWLTRNAS